MCNRKLHDSIMLQALGIITTLLDFVIKYQLLIVRQPYNSAQTIALILVKVRWSPVAQWAANLEGASGFRLVFSCRPYLRFLRTGFVRLLAFFNVLRVFGKR